MWVSHTRDRHGSGRPAVVPDAERAGDEPRFPNAMDRVAALGALLAQLRAGEITDAEYEAAKARIFDGAPPPL